MLDARIEAILRRVGHGKTSWYDELELRQYMQQLHQQAQDALDKARRGP